ncbi:beta strand repeat-containing protein [Sediminicola sp. 1XM1-17]|uniref:beta strand repeat-containing protein n=1 Tax=Sediminicola sp. 1XM1-17 TaxID=3127702 RepID=UPI003077E4F1
MRLKDALFISLISIGTLTYGQIKIGDNPQNINQASVLELESTSRALVITRVNSAQMNAIAPLAGALVYNTDSECIHYYNGNQWFNLCDALANSINISLVDNGDGTYTFSDANNNITQINNLNESLVVDDGNLILTDTAGNAISVELQNLSAQTFTTDAIINTFPTIFITQDASGNNFNFEVGVIDGESIQDGTIFREDLAPNSVTQSKLSQNAVTNNAMADNAVGSLEIINGSVQPVDLGPGSNNQILTTNATGVVQWVDQSGLVAADEVSYNNGIAGLAANNVQDALDEVTGNINTLTVADILTQGNNAGNQIISNLAEPVLPQDAATRNYVDAQVGSSAQIIVSSNTPNSIAAGTDGGALYNDGDTDDTNELSNLFFNASTNILTLTNPATPANAVDLSSLSDTGSDNQNLTGASLSGTVLQIDIEDGNSTSVDLGALSGVDTDDQQISLSGNILTLEDGGPPINLAPFLDNTDNQSITDFTFDNTSNILTITIEGGNTDTADLSFLAGAGNPAAVDVTFTPNGNTTSDNVQLAIEELQTEIDGISGGGAANPSDELITSFTLNGTDLNIAEGANVLPAVDLSSLLGTDDQVANEVVFSPIGNTTSNNVQAAIEEIQTQVDGLTAGGEVNTASNQGVGGIPIFIQKTGVDLEFKSINAASNKVSVTNDGPNNEVDIDVNEANLTITESQISDLTHTVDTDNQTALQVPFTPTGNTTSADVQAAIVELQTDIDGIATGGEVNTGSNQGVGGIPIFIQKTGIDLEFKSINAASNKVSVTNDGPNNEVDIDVNEANLTITESQISDLSHTPAAAVVTFAPTGNTTSANVQAAIEEIQTEVDGIATGGEVNTGSNQGVGGIPIFIQKTGVDLEFKSINAASNKVSVTNDGPNNEVDVDINETNLTITESQISDLSHTPAAAVVTFAPTGNTTSANVQAAIEEIQTEVDGIATGGEVNTGSNQGVGGIPIFIQKTGVDLEFKSINAASNKVSVINDGPNNEVDIDINESNLVITGGPSGNISSNSISQGDIGDNAIGPGEIQSNAVSSDEIDDDSIFNIDINSGAAISGTKIDPNFGAQPVVTTGTLAAGDTTITGDLNVSNTVTVAATVVHPDYVFQKYFLGTSSLKKDYEFSTLEKVAHFIEKHHHLPGIKSAAEVKEAGFWNLTEGALKNLEKIEELFLHTIEQEKKIVQLKLENETLSLELVTLKKDLEEIKALLKKE